MTTTLGTKPISVLVDSDAIIALVHSQDALHTRALKIAEYLSKADIPLFITATTIAEVVTTIERKYSDIKSAAVLFEKLISGWVEIISIDADTIKDARKIFAKLTSKQHTVFDVINMVVVKRHNISAIFSFDEWYRKQKLHFIEDLIEI